ncbi:MAG: hypothetical protein AAB646_01350 [Patescibacteria group bacterium]
METEYDRTTPVDQRKYYVNGVGQLCQECYEKTCGNTLADS